MGITFQLVYVIVDLITTWTKIYKVRGDVPTTPFSLTVWRSMYPLYSTCCKQQFHLHEESQRLNSKLKLLLFSPNKLSPLPGFELESSYPKADDIPMVHGESLSRCV